MYFACMGDFNIKPVIKLEMFLFQPLNQIVVNCKINDNILLNLPSFCYSCEEGYKFTHKRDLLYRLSRTKSLPPMDCFNSNVSNHLYFQMLPQQHEA